MPTLPPIPADINAAPSSLRSELINVIDTLVDAAQPTATPGGGNDLIFGTDIGQIIDGFSGNDVMAGLAGNDRIFSGEGDDYVLGGLGSDQLFGGDGNDILFGEAGNDRLYGSVGDDAMFGGAGNDIVDGGEGNDWQFGNDGGDRMIGGFGNDFIDGGTGNDNISGGTGNDELRAGAGNDIVAGGEDNDFVEGNAGGDRLSGGLGADVYFYASRAHGGDTLLDFESSQDRFEFSGLGFGVDPGTNLDDGTTFIANTAPVSAVLAATVLYETDTGRLMFDIDGIGAQAAQLIATISGAPQVTNQDFIFV